LLLFTLGSASLYQRSQIDPIYFTDDLLPHHLVWHSAYIGLQLHPQWPERIPMKELAGLWGDEAPFTLSRLLLMASGIPHAGGAAGRGFRARLHDRVIRSAYLDFLWRNPGYSFELFTYHKQRRLILYLTQMVNSIPATAWLLAGVSLCVGGALFSSASNPRTSELLLSVSIVFLCSLAPTTWAFPTPHVMAEQLWSTLFLGACVLALSAAVAVRQRRWVNAAST
jgi:hypothetical protein